ncbi:NAD-dependent epimerase/dehydratase family protein [Desulfobotulus sp. H1]|uniref:NAD-dependent epimerase/dehydratase family protein n=1 Tax=Desulfobotulus pelophilus TaxID=2823377 RepID=A0ABT3N888_9BACT|nr:NAD-dependent epimerase/dehydratase family protein [Desulfobotulus pelophilus]MCW7753665.1 NAD-dependent epimerase/dehydratase family protein [Desulfobotulus pelophilus]
MHILITGGAGFIGSHTADALLAQGHRVRVLDCLQPTVHPMGLPSYLSPDIEFIRGDVRSKADWVLALDGVDAVYHFAAYQDYLTDFSTFYHVNAVGTALLYEILAEQGDRRRVTKVIVATSQAVMGEGLYHCPSCSWEGVPDIRDESRLKQKYWEHPCPLCGHNLDWQASSESIANPCNPYALSKDAQEKAALRLGRREDIDTTVLRYSIVQGPRQSFFNAYSGAMRIFSLCLYCGRSPLIFEDGLQIRDFVNIHDVVDANLLVLEHPEAKGRILNVGGGRAYTVNTFYETMQNITGKRIAPEKSSHYRYGDTRHIFSDITALQSLGWQPGRGIEESILAYWQHLHESQAQEDILAYADAHMKKLNVIREAKG